MPNSIIVSGGNLLSIVFFVGVTSIPTHNDQNHEINKFWCYFLIWFPFGLCAISAILMLFIRAEYRRMDKENKIANNGVTFLAQPNKEDSL